MIRHCVFVRYSSDVPQSEKNGINADITALKALVPGFLSAEFGVNVSPETGMDKGYSEGFILDFDGPASRDAYLVHPDHQKVGGRIVAAAEGGVAGIIVFDMDIG